MGDPLGLALMIIGLYIPLYFIASKMDRMEERLKALSEQLLYIGLEIEELQEEVRKHK